MRTEYKDLEGNSGIVAYEIFEDAIDIEYKSGGVYTYTKENLGDVNFAIVVSLAIAGAGLNAFLNKIRNRHSRRTPNPFATVNGTPKETVKVSLATHEAVAVVTELLKNFDVTLSVS